MTHKALIKQLEDTCFGLDAVDPLRLLVDDVIAALAQQEPVAWMYPDALCDRACLYLCTKGFTQFPECATIPPQRTWVGLTDEEIDDLWESTASYYNTHDFARAIEAKLKEKNT